MPKFLSELRDMVVELYREKKEKEEAALRAAGDVEYLEGKMRDAMTRYDKLREERAAESGKAYDDEIKAIQDAMARTSLPVMLSSYRNDIDGLNEERDTDYGDADSIIKSLEAEGAERPRYSARVGDGGVGGGIRKRRKSKRRKSHKRKSHKRKSYKRKKTKKGKRS